VSCGGMERHQAGGNGPKRGGRRKGEGGGRTQIRGGRGAGGGGQRWLEGRRARGTPIAGGRRGGHQDHPLHLPVAVHTWGGATPAPLPVQYFVPIQRCNVNEPSLYSIDYTPHVRQTVRICFTAKSRPTAFTILIPDPSGAPGANPPGISRNSGTIRHGEGDGVGTLSRGGTEGQPHGADGRWALDGGEGGEERTQ